jgi:hypothetical protein
MRSKAIQFPPVSVGTIDATEAEVDVEAISYFVDLSLFKILQENFVSKKFLKSNLSILIAL